MAIDSAQKRASATHFLTYNYTQLVIPDGTISATDRQAATLVYSGIAAGGAAAPSTRNPYIGFLVNISLLMNR